MVEYYSIQSNEWCELAHLPVAVQGTGAVFLDQQLYVVGGRTKTNYESRAWVCFCSVTMNEFLIICVKTEGREVLFIAWDDVAFLMSQCVAVET